MCYGNVSSISNNNNNNNNNNINNGKQIMSNNSIKDNFKTPLTPLHRGGLGELHKGVIKGIHSRGLEVLAFSLIELSIVLIIIGLLVAGITGGASLIESARARALMNELREYERAVWTFKAARDRFPGDVANLGTFGDSSNYYNSYIAPTPYYAYKATDFPSNFITEFRKTAGSSAIPNYDSAIFVDLYTEGIIDFKPLGNNRTADKSSTTKGIPNSKAIDTNNVFLWFAYVGFISTFSGTPASGGDFRTGIRDFGAIKEVLYYHYSGSNAKKGMNPKILKQVDLKLDDGEYWNGRIRSSCFGESDTTIGHIDYDYAIENGKKCNSVCYAL